MLVYLPAQMTQPGVIQTHMATKSGVLDLCRFPGAVDERCSEIARRLSSANFSSRPNPEVMRFKYEKLLMNLRNGLGAICGNGSEQEAVYQQMRREGEACYTAAGIDWASEDEVKELRRDTIVRGKIEGVEEVGNSTFQSLLRQTGDAESDFLNGEICLLGRRHSVLTPAHHVVQRLSNDLARRRGRPQSISIEEVGRLIKMGEA